MTLTAIGLSVHFAGLRAVDNVSVWLERGEILGLVGPNGAGKTTLVNVLSGFQLPGQGCLTLEGTTVTGRHAAWMARHGVVRTFQAVRLFRGLSVLENVQAALTSLNMGRVAGRRKALEVLDYMGIAERADLAASALSYGDERRVGIARALALAPRFLLLDEPAAGMNVAEARALGELIKRIRHDMGCGILLIEHNMRLIARTCERLQAMASGRTIAQGTPEAVLADPGFRSAWLGPDVVDPDPVDPEAVQT